MLCSLHLRYMSAWHSAGVNWLRKGVSHATTWKVHNAASRPVFIMAARHEREIRLLPSVQYSTVSKSSFPPKKVLARMEKAEQEREREREERVRLRLPSQQSFHLLLSTFCARWSLLFSFLLSITGCVCTMHPMFRDKTFLTWFLIELKWEWDHYKLRGGIGRVLRFYYVGGLLGRDVCLEIYRIIVIF